MFILDLDFFPSRIQGVKKAPDPGFATLVSAKYMIKNYYFRTDHTLYCLTRYSNQNHTKIGIKKEDALAPLLISCKNYEKLVKIFPTAK
jgi:hypothetical protein